MKAKRDAPKLLKYYCISYFTETYVASNLDHTFYFQECCPRWKETETVLLEWKLACNSLICSQLERWVILFLLALVYICEVESTMNNPTVG